MAGKQAAAAANLEVEVTVVPTSGKPQVETVTVTPTVPLRDVLAKAGIATKDRDFYVDGKPATLDTPVGHGQKVTGKVKASVQERPAGS